METGNGINLQVCRILFNSLYKEALLYRNYEEPTAKDSSEALRQLTQNLSTFNLEYDRELGRGFTLEDLKRFTEKWHPVMKT